MPTPDDDDWRLRGQEQSLLDAELTYAKYAPSDPNSDHDHCEFCWAKFMDADLPNVQRTGYRTTDGSDWICETCFADFKQKLRWTVRS